MNQGLNLNLSLNLLKLLLFDKIDCILPSTNDDYSEHKQEKTRIIEINRGTINHSLLISDESVKTQSRATDLKYLHLLQLSLNFVFFFYF